MRILVTGSAGHLGEALMRTLRAADRPCVGLDLLPSPFTDIVGSIVEPAIVERAMDGVDVVLHTATLHKPHPRQAFIDTNLTGTLNLLEASARVRAFVFTSTTSTFGDALVPPLARPAAWITEAVVPAPKNIYGVTKVAIARSDGSCCRRSIASTTTRSLAPSSVDNRVTTSRVSSSAQRAATFAARSRVWSA